MTLSIAKKARRRKSFNRYALPVIPNKRYFTISEVGVLCGVKPHVLRYWEQEFAHLKPLKRQGNRRYYQLKDILIVRQICQLLYEEGFTIEGARTKLMGNNRMASQSDNPDKVVKNIITGLEDVLNQLKVKCPA